MSTGPVVTSVETVKTATGTIGVLTYIGLDLVVLRIALGANPHNFVAEWRMNRSMVNDLIGALARACDASKASDPNDRP